MSDELPALATPAEVAHYVHTTIASLAQDATRAPGRGASREEDGCFTAGPTSWNGWTTILFSGPMNGRFDRRSVRSLIACSAGRPLKRAASGPRQSFGSGPRCRLTWPRSSSRCRRSSRRRRQDREVAGQQRVVSPRRSPPSFAPLFEMGTLGTQRRVVTVAGVDDCLVRVDIEHPAAHIAEERVELRRFCCPSQTARE
jgi:hypothetical protein